jgi:hypothetical protein
VAVPLLYNWLLTLVPSYRKDDYDLCAKCFAFFGKADEYIKIDMPAPSRMPGDLNTVILFSYISYVQYCSWFIISDNYCSINFSTQSSTSLPRFVQ